MSRFYYFAIFILLFWSIPNTYAQTNLDPPLTITTGDTVFFCPPEQVPLHAEISPSNPIGVAGTQIPEFYNGTYVNNDDGFSGVINIGFSFEFYGQAYTQCVVSSNNYICFDLSYSKQYSPWSIPGPAPSASTPENSIMCPWQDIYPYYNNQGVVRYQTIGTAPNRVFIVEYCSIPMFSCTGMLFTDQIKLFETSNVIETHIVEKPLCSLWNSGQAVHGLSKDAITADIVPGRNAPTQWETFNDGYRFTPKANVASATGLNNAYDMEPIPFAPFLMEVDENSIQWFAEGDPVNPIGTGPDITVNPGTQTYYVAKISSGGQCAGVTYTDTVFFRYGLTYDTAIVELCAGETYNFYGKILYTPGYYDTTFLHDNTCDTFLTIDLRVHPRPDITIKGDKNVSICSGDSVRVALANPESANTYQWLKDGVPITGETHPEIMFKSAGAYTIIATTNYGCVDSATVKVSEYPNPTAEIEPFDNEIICAYDTAQLSAVSGTNYDYRWTPEKPFRTVTGPEGRVVRGVFTEPTLVVLTVNNEFGCHDSASVMINTKPCCDVFVPSAFSPNGDGNNDLFKPQLQLGQILTWMKIFNRNGQLVYDNKTPEKGWDGNFDNGQPAPMDTYMYYIEYTCSDGQIYHKKESVTLVR